MADTYTEVHPRGPDDSAALDKIHHILDSTEHWSADTLDEIFEVVRASGREFT